MKIRNQILKFNPLEIKHGLDDIKISIASLRFNIDFNVSNSSMARLIEFKVIVKNNPYYLSGKMHYKDIKVLFIVGTRSIDFNDLLREKKIQIHSPRDYTILYDDEKKCIDIKISGHQKTVINDFELGLMLHQIEKAKEKIKEKIC
jgi:hypothetical protein